MGNTSIILIAESKVAYVDGVLSSGIGLAAIVAYFITDDSPLEFLLYIGDSIIVIALVLASIKEPIKVLFEAFKELTNGIVTNDEIIKPIKENILNELSVDVTLSECRVRKVGTSFHVNAILDFNSDTLVLKDYKEFRTKLENALASQFDNISLNIIIH